MDKHYAKQLEDRDKPERLVALGAFWFSTLHGEPALTVDVTEFDEELDDDKVVGHETSKLDMKRTVRIQRRSDVINLTFHAIGAEGYEHTRRCSLSHLRELVPHFKRLNVRMSMDEYTGSVADAIEFARKQLEIKRD